MSVGLLLLRLIVGGIFAAHGYPKLFGGQGKPIPQEAARYLGPGFAGAWERGSAGFAGMLRSLGVPMAEVMALVVGAVEFFGGLLLAVGGLTRPAALLLSGDMLVAIWKVHRPHGLYSPSGYELPLSALGACLALIFAGPGKLSLDALACGLGKLASRR